VVVIEQAGSFLKSDKNYEYFAEFLKTLRVIFIPVPVDKYVICVGANMLLEAKILRQTNKTFTLM